MKHQDIALALAAQRDYISIDDLDTARGIVNFVIDNLDANEKSIHEGVDHPGSIDWDGLAGQQGDHLTLVGHLGVDGASVKVTISIGENDVDYKTHIYTPDGDGTFEILAGRLTGLGRCLVVAFDREMR